MNQYAVRQIPESLQVSRCVTRQMKPLLMISSRFKLTLTSSCLPFHTWMRQESARTWNPGNMRPESTVRVCQITLRLLRSLVSDPEANQVRRTAASAWKTFSTQVRQAIPFSMVRHKTRETNKRKGKPVAREFNVHGLEHESETDGAERPRDKCFKPGERRHLSSFGCAT